MSDIFIKYPFQKKCIVSVDRVVLEKMMFELPYRLVMVTMETKMPIRNQGLVKIPDKVNNSSKASPGPLTLKF